MFSVLITATVILQYIAGELPDLSEIEKQYRQLCLEQIKQTNAGIPDAVSQHIISSYTTFTRSELNAFVSQNATRHWCSIL
jgi:hypothetical protein